MPSGIYIRRNPIWNKGKKYPQFSGKNNGRWKGNNAGYSAIHKWIQAILGKATKCSNCSKEGNGHKIQWANKDHKCRRRVKDYFQLCAKCHRLYDKYVLHSLIN